MVGRIRFDTSITLSYRVAFYGFRIGINNWNVTLYGLKTGSSADKAQKMDPENPFAYVQIANVKYYQPEFMGGDKTKAIEYYLKAEMVYLKQKPEVMNVDWGCI